jgi:septal ring factor EnvC (AmiA/AmiB activator)
VKYLFKIINGKDFLFLMDSKDALSLEKKEKFLKIVINNDLNLIKKYLLKLKELNNSIDTYENEIKKLKETQNELIKQKEVLVSERKEKKLYLEKVRKSKSLNKKLQREKKVVSNNVNKKLKSNTKKSGFITMKGSFDFPVNAKVYKWYSVKYIKETKSYEIHKGLTFKVAIGTRVHSIYEGSIVFADYIKGFGKTIIISHGDGYYSIYMHLDSILKKSGDKVVARDIIGLSGASGTTEYPKLYFEIRKKKDSININKWFNIKK